MKGGIERKKSENVKLKEDVPGAIYLEKNQKNAPWNSSRDGFFAVEPKQSERKRSSYKGKYARTGKFLKLFLHKKHKQLACLVIIQGGCSTCSPKQSHKWVRV